MKLYVSRSFDLCCLKYKKKNLNSELNMLRALHDTHTSMFLQIKSFHNYKNFLSLKSLDVLKKSVYL